LESDNEVFNVLLEETAALKSKHGRPRKSKICDDESILSDEDLLANEKSVIIVTRSGYVKRLPIEEFEAQSRGTKGKAGAKLSTEEDSVAHFFSCNDHDSVLFVTAKGIAYSVRAHQIPLASRIAKGVPLPQVLPISAEDEVTSIIPVDKFGENEYLILLTKNGTIKRTPLKVLYAHSLYINIF
jgi:DNA gyrase subunit A